MSARTRKAIVSFAAARPRAATDRVPWIDTGRGIAILLVTLYHSTSWLLGAGFHVQWWITIDETLASLRMPLFFTLSGLFAPKWLRASWSDLLRSKVLLFVWVFLIWETIGALFFQLGLVMQDKCCGVRDTVVGLVLSPIMPIYELWFIWALALFFILARATRRVDVRLQIGVAAIAAFVALMGWSGINDGWEGVFKYYLFFVSGIYLRAGILRFGSTPRRGLLVGALAVWAVISITVAAFGLTHLPGVYFVNSLAGVLGGIALSRFLTPVSFLARIGRQTLPIYLAHTPIILAIAFVIHQTPLLGPLLPLAPILPPVIAGLAVVIALFVYRRVEGTPARFLYEPPPALSRSRTVHRTPSPVSPDTAEGPR
ncbi:MULTISPECIES: acyltransferase family protein [unclassified Frondihabitans]|uniref:acyltransferase family protein n=1 Tax=unclassified Frondihabitans TaxID=2626248 RepID=UPI000F50EB06|nr:MULTISPECIES: acyltransferase family protein [unclassified Frondihabitans]RPE78771.1 putative membrane protein YcfT [Frondihabitans sp. PhB153]RPF09052.1 putative membrane protein YcfT [Frondihabitans sp. PhB161]